MQFNHCGTLLDGYHGFQKLDRATRARAQGVNGTPSERAQMIRALQEVRKAAKTLREQLNMASAPVEICDRKYPDHVRAALEVLARRLPDQKEFGQVYYSDDLTGRMSYSGQRPSDQPQLRYRQATVYRDRLVGNVRGKAAVMWSVREDLFSDAKTNQHVLRKLDASSSYGVAPGEEPTDICGYCGFDNGPSGEYRNGWDCGGCGSN